jgi:hypothetical protein
MIVIKLFNQSTGDFLGYLKSYDPDKGNETVTGDIVATQDIWEAMGFPNISSALAYGMQQSKRVPLRPDGEPNRPLTAFTLEFEPRRLP